MVQLSIAQILSASNNIITNPNKSVFEELGVNAVDAGLLIISPQLFEGSQGQVPSNRNEC